MRVVIFTRKKHLLISRSEASESPEEVEGSYLLCSAYPHSNLTPISTLAISPLATHTPRFPPSPLSLFPEPLLRHSEP